MGWYKGGDARPGIWYNCGGDRTVLKFVATEDGGKIDDVETGCGELPNGGRPFKDGNSASVIVVKDFVEERSITCIVGNA